jgi:aconitate hydratase
MPVTGSQNSFDARKTLDVDGRNYAYYSLDAAMAAGLPDVARLPFSLKVILENLLRFEDGRTVTADHVKAVADWLLDRTSNTEIAYRPARVLMQDFTGVPAVVDLAAMRDAMTAMGGDPRQINPLVPVDLVIDHSVMVDSFGGADSFEKNVAYEYERNKERYEFLRWGAGAFDNFRVVPPGTGICHQVNLEYLAQVVWTADADGATLAYPDTLVGTDSHTTMVNGLSVLGWGVGGIEAEAGMLGQPVSMLIPEVVGFKLKGRMKEGTTATDLVLTVTQILRKKGVVGKFVEFYGAGLDNLTLADQATIANMAPEYGATCGFFPVDRSTIDYLTFTGRDADRVALVEAYSKAQGMWRDTGTPDPVFTDTLELDLDEVEPSLAGPKRPQDRVALTHAASSFARALGQIRGGRRDPAAPAADAGESRYVEEGATGADTSADGHFLEGGMKPGGKPVDGVDYHLADGDVVIAAITSCTNTSNPSVLIAAGLLARNARRRGLQVQPWVKTSLAPGSQVVTDYLAAAGLSDDLDSLGFGLVGYGCTTCIGNSGPLAEPISDTINAHDLVVCSVLSGNRNFEGRVNPDVRANYLASPPLVVAYALAGSLRIDITRDPLGRGPDGRPVYLKDVWPSNREVQDIIRDVVTPEMFAERYRDVFNGDELWRGISVGSGTTYDWRPSSTYVQNPPYFEGIASKPSPPGDIEGARILGLFEDSITTDHISPAGSIKSDGPAGNYLVEHQVRPVDFNSYGARRGNHEVMMRGTFANIRIRNQMAPGTEGGVTVHHPSGDKMPVFDAAMRYRDEGVPLVVFAGMEYGTGSSRDWAAKGTRLLGVRAVICQSFERIHRSNLVGMGVLPLTFRDGQSWRALGITGNETVSITGIGAISPRSTLTATITGTDGSRDVDLLCRIDTEDELIYYRNGGILPFMLRRLAAA